MNPKQTSPLISALAAKLLQDSKTSRDALRVSGSALSQARPLRVLPPQRKVNLVLKPVLTVSVTYTYNFFR